MTTLRSILFLIWLYGGMAVLSILALPSLFLPVPVVLWFIRVYTRFLLFGLRWICGVKTVFRGLEHIPEGPVLIAGKHQAMLDVFVPFLLFSQPVLVMKRELLWYPFLGWYALKARMLPIDRSGGARTMRHMLRIARQRITLEGRQMLIYPEGTRQAPGAVPAYKPAGVRAFYKALDVAILPLATNAGLCWPAHGLTRTPGTIVYEALPVIEPGLPQKQMLARLEQVLEAGSNRLLAEENAARGVLDGPGR